MSDTLRRDLTMMLCDEALPGYHRAVVRRAIAELDRLEAEVKKPRYSGELPQPMFWAYRYHDCIRFNGGSEVNGSRPIEAIPLYTAEQMRAFLTTPDVVPSATTEPVHAAGDGAGELSREHRLHLALVSIANQMLSSEMDDERYIGASFQEGYDACVMVARNELSPAETSDRGQGSGTPMNTETAKPERESLEESFFQTWGQTIEEWRSNGSRMPSDRNFGLWLVRKLDERGA